METINLLEKAKSRQTLNFISSIFSSLNISKVNNKKLKRLALAIITAFTIATENSPTVNADGGTCVVTATPNTNINIREGPGTNYPVIGTLTPYEYVDYEYTQNGWHLIEEDGNRGWVFEDISILRQCDTAQSIVEGMNNRNGIRLPFRDYGNILIFGDENVLTDQQTLDLFNLIQSYTNTNLEDQCSTRLPLIIVYGNIRDMYTLVPQIGRNIHSVAGSVNFDGESLWPTTYCEGNTHPMAFINIETSLSYFFITPEEAALIAAPHELSHVLGSEHFATNISTDTEVEVMNAYWWGNMGHLAFLRNCRILSNPESQEVCNEIQEIYEEQ